MQDQDDDRKLFSYDDVSVSEQEYQATQVFYTNEPLNAQEMDQITSIEYSRDGDHLAVGDRGGRIWIYSTNDGRNKCKPKPFSAFIVKNTTHNNNINNSDDSKNSHDERPMDNDELTESGRKYEEPKNKSTLNRGLVYDFYGQFQSHQPEFDYLKSLEIEEKINCISWCRCANNSLSLLACNDKTIKLWKVFEKSMYRQSGNSFHKKFKTEYALNENEDAFHNVTLPQIECDDVITAAISRRVYQNGHKFHIHSLDVNCDCETFISSDDLGINLWHFDSPNTSFNLCELKPESMEDLQNSITKAILHPNHCNYMAYTTTQSQICFCDMRQNCQINRNIKEFGSTKLYQYEQPLIRRDFFTDLGSYISGVTFTSDGQCMIVRDYFNMYTWDIRNNKKPLKILPVHPYYANDMKHLYESDLLFDKFEIASSPTSMAAATGTYNNSFIVSDWESNTTQKYVLNANHVAQWQSKMKKSEKKLKKMNKLKRMKNKNREKANVANKYFTNDTSYDDKIIADVMLENHNNNELESKENKDIMQNDKGNTIDNRMPRDVPRDIPKEIVKPHWLESSYFQKGNFDQKVLYLSWHPTKDVIAAVSGSQLLVFQNL